MAAWASRSSDMRGVGHEMEHETRRISAICGAAALLLGACGGNDSALAPEGPGAERIAGITWVMFVVATVITAGVLALLVVALFRRRARRDGDAEPDDTDRRTERWVIAGGVVLPVVVLVPVAALAVAVLDDAPASELRIEVVAHQYWWEYRYPDLGVVTANELHIPAGETVTLEMRSDDVVHSLWVPALGGKTDLVPGRTTTMTLEADDPGTFQGRCAEYCGLQHAKMLFLVVAQGEDDFADWVDAQGRDAVSDPSASAGADLFAEAGCASCHTVRGTEADGPVGPDLTHIASRRTLGAGVLDNDPDGLRRWIGETWEVKDGITMPPVPLTDEEVDAIASYLETLE